MVNLYNWILQSTSSIKLAAYGPSISQDCYKWPDVFVDNNIMAQLQKVRYPDNTKISLKINVFDSLLNEKVIYKALCNMIHIFLFIIYYFNPH